MRVLAPLVVMLLILAPVSAEFGEEQNGYPVGEGGLLHDPAVAFEPEALAAIQQRAMEDPRLAELLGNDYPQLNRAGPATLYPYYPILTAEIQRLVLDHPDKVRLQTGTSTLGLDIHYLEIANWGDEGSEGFVPIDEREVVMIDGGTHSNEYSGVYFVLALAQWLLDGSPEDEFAQWVLENRFTIITPLVNPDGSHAMGRLNVNAVNINRNFPVLWGGDGTDMLLNNPGPSAMSETETQLVVDRVEHYRPDYHGSIHCCGNLWLFPYGEDGYDPLDVDMLNRVCDEAYPAEIREDCGPIWSTIYPASGSTVDTVYEYTGAVAFGFEMSGRGRLAGPWGEPLTFEEVAVQEAESWGGVMHAFEHVHRYGGHPVIEDVAAVSGGLDITIRNDGMGNLSGMLLPSGSAKEPLPFEDVPPGATVRLHVEGPVEAGEWVLDYSKRIMPTSNAALLDVPVAVDGGNVTIAGIEVTPTEEVLEAADQEASGLPLVMLLGLLVLLVRRRVA